jgi:hypothetical protein
MAQLKFYRKSTAPTKDLAAGAIWFNTSDKTIQIYTGTEWEKYAGNLKDATWSTDNKTLTITKHDGSSIGLDFSDMASATVMGNMITAVGLDTKNGTFKKNAINYGTTATSIGGEITAIDAKLKGVSDLVGTTAVATQISNATANLIGRSGDDKTADTIYGAKADAKAKADIAESNAKGYTDDALEALTDTVSSTTGEKVVVSVNQIKGKVDTVTVTLNDIASASELANVKKTAEDAQTASEVSTAITNAINALDATVKDEHDANVKVSVTETDGKLTGVTVTTADIASATTLAEVKGKVDAFFKGANIDETVETYKDTLLELQTYITEDAAAAVTMTESIAANKNNIGKLAIAKVNNKNFAVTQIGTDGTTTITSAGVTLNGADIKIDGYTKGTATDLAATDTINQALGKLEARVDAAAAGGVQSVNGKTGAVTIATGASNGSIKVGDADVAVKGLGSAAYTASTAYATAAQGNKADSALQEITSANTAAIEIANKSVVTPKIASNTELVSMNYLNQASGNSPLVDAAGAQHLVKTYVDTTIEDALAWAEF